VTERVVVVLATYDGSDYLREQLESIAAQTRRPDLVLVRDDGSSDDTVALARQVLSRAGLDHDVSVNPRRLGAAGNFAAALEDAAGEVVFLCDQDDVWHPEKVEALLAPLAAGAVAAFSNGRVVDAEGAPTGEDVWSRSGFTAQLREQWRAGAALDVLVRRSVTPGATLAFRAELLTSALPVPAAGWHDHWLLLVAAATGQVVPVERALVDYRVHGANAVGLEPGRASARLVRRLRSGVGADQDLLRAELAQLTELARRVEGEAAGLVRAAAEHTGRRLALPRSRTRRTAAVAAELRRGGYQRYAQGWRSAAADLLSGGADT
jgi:hypothetical protein